MGTLILQDGSVIKGKSYGAIGGYMGEIVFNTSITGYQEIITDPSYARQIVIMTYPEIGNYGINESDFESANPALVGFISKNCCNQESHYQARYSISEYLIQKGIVALYDIDTRSLVKKIREYGTMNAFITSADVDDLFIKKKIEEIQNFKIDASILDTVTTSEKIVYNPNGKINLAFIDYGAKKNIVLSLIKRGCKVTVFPSHTDADEILKGKFDAVFLSNGPGDPAEYTYQIEQIKKLTGNLPIFGICLGYQLLALAAGAKTYKLKYGHRGGNHPVINLENNKVMMTSQNHGYAVDMISLESCMRPTYKNLNDNTLEGFEITSLGIYAVQFHPEAKPGPEEGESIFDEWINIIKRNLKLVNEVKNEK